MGFSRESLGYNAKFVYPRQGGISALPRALSAALKTPPKFNTAITRVDLKTRTATLSNGDSVRFKHLLNTMALPRFMATLADVPEEIRTATTKLRAATVHYFDIGVRGPGDIASAHHWIYFPEPEFIFYRAGSYSAVHPSSAPPGCRSYYVEMSGGADEWLKRPEELKQRVLADLKKARVLSDRDEVLFMELCDIPFAYVVFDDYYEGCRKQILDWLATQDVQSHGRWGGWNYGGMEDALLDGKAAASTLSNS
jgi:protoporphyrinogen oxidase